MILYWQCVKYVFNSNLESVQVEEKEESQEENLHLEGGRG